MDINVKYGFVMSAVLMFLGLGMLLTSPSTMTPGAFLILVVIVMYISERISDA